MNKFLHHLKSKGYEINGNTAMLLKTNVILEIVSVIITGTIRKEKRIWRTLSLMCGSKKCCINRRKFMKKIICDICGKEIKDNENWIVVLNRNENNSINKPDFKAEDICKKCAKNIYNCLRMMTECNWKPDFHEATESGDFINDEQCYFKLEKINEEWNNK